MSTFLTDSVGFVPCDPSELFVPAEGGQFEFPFGACYQLYDPTTGNTIVGAGSPSICCGSYSGSKVLFSGTPDQVLVRDGLLYAALFSNGLVADMGNDNRFDLKRAVALAVAKDVEVDGRIIRNFPRPFQISPRR